MKMNRIRAHPIARFRWKGVLALAAACMVLAAGPGPMATSAPAVRDTLVAVIARAPATLDPADHRTRESETVIRNMYDGIVTRDTKGGVHMEIAERVTWLDARTLEVRIRPGVKFHDGSPLSADDVVFTFERTIKENAIEYPRPHTSPRKGLVEPLLSITRRDALTVVMNFRGAWPSGLQQLVQHQIVSKAYVERNGTRGLVERPMGAGPFKFVSAKTGLEEVVMERFDDYFGGAPTLPPVGKACVPRAVFRVMPETSSRVAALLAGEVDIITEVPAELVTRLRRTPGIQVKTVPGTRPLWMEMNVKQAPFTDARVRRALNYAIDKDLIINKVYGGMAKPLAGPLSPLNNFADTSLKPYPYDRDRALALLREAGWTPGAGGMLTKDGAPFTFVIDTIDSIRSLAEALSTMFRDIGIDARVRIWEYNVIRPRLLAGERQAYVGDWGDAAFDPVGHMEAKWVTYRDATYGRGNFSGYSNARVDALVRDGEVEADPDRRRAMYNEAQRLIYVDAPAVFLVLPEAIEAASIRVQNWEPASDSRVNLHDVCLR
jgi:peptide/nickel transport system substrate-binding protein